LIPLHLFELGMARFTPFRILGVATFSKVLLSGGSKNKLLTTLATDQNPRFKPVTHRDPPLFWLVQASVLATRNKGLY